MALLLLLGARAASAQEADPIHWKAALGAVQAKAGSLISVPVVATIDAGWHLYSLKKLTGGPIPTTLGVGPGPTFRLDGKIESPEPILMDDPNFGMTVEFYLETAQFVLPVRVAPEAAPGRQLLKVTARYQSCSEKICLPPKMVTIEIPVTVGR